MHKRAGGPSSARWYRLLAKPQWKALIAAQLGWTLDGFEVFSLILTVGVALRELLDGTQHASIPAYAGVVISITVLGWGVGGLIGGVLADYIGRRRTMILAILAYSLTTGLSAFAWSWTSFAILRWFVGLAIGSEWASGAAMLAEVWPDAARGRGGALMQCGYPIGSVLASGLWLVIGDTGPDAWRFMYLVGVLPALLAFWIRRGIAKSSLWEELQQRREVARQHRLKRATVDPGEAALARFTLIDLFAEPTIRLRCAVVTLLMSLSVTIGYFWGFHLGPDLCRLLGDPGGCSSPALGGIGGLTQNLGAILGYISFGLLADSLGRKPTTLAFYLGSDAPTSRRLYLGAAFASAAGDVCDLWLLRPGDFRLASDLASGTIPHTHAGHRDCGLLQCAAVDFGRRSGAGRQIDRRPWQLRSSGGAGRAVLCPRPDGDTLAP